MKEERKRRAPTEGWLRRSAMHYLASRSSSAANLGRVLTGRANRRLGPEAEGVEALVEDAVGFCVRNGFVDDAAYAQSKVASGVRRGLSRSRLSNDLRAKGIDRELADETLGEGADDETAAVRFARRKRLGPWRTKPESDVREKEFGAMARGGFASGIVRRVLSMDLEEAEAIVYGETAFEP